jgi:hypothetical protein
MPSIKDLLRTSASTFKAPPRFPAGNYVVVIESYDMLEFFWKKSGTRGLAYVPTIRPLSCIEADDDSNPELQKEQQELLEKYGDWTSKTFQFAYTSRDTNQRMATISEINFPLIELDDAGEPQGMLDKMTWRFYQREDDGTEQGFVADILGLSYPENAEIGDIIEDTVGKKFMLSFVYEPNVNDPTRPPNLTIESVTQA